MRASSSPPSLHDELTALLSGWMDRIREWREDADTDPNSARSDYFRALSIGTEDCLKQLAEIVSEHEPAIAEALAPSPGTENDQKEPDARVDGDAHSEQPLTAASNEVAPSFFDRPSKLERNDDPDGGECVAVRYEAGGVVLIHTNKPLLWIEPERH